MAGARLAWRASKIESHIDGLDFGSPENVSRSTERNLARLGIGSLMDVSSILSL